MAKQPVAQQRQRREDGEPRNGNKHQRREDTRNAKPVGRFQDAVRKTGFSSTCSGHELSDNGADQCEAARNAKSGKVIGKADGSRSHSMVCHLDAP